MLLSLPVWVSVVFCSEDWQQPAEEHHHQSNSCHTHNCHTHTHTKVTGHKSHVWSFMSRCVCNVLFLLPISRSEEAASHSITIPMVIAASDTKVKVNLQNYGLRINLNVQQRETKRPVTFGIKSVRTYNQGYWKAERCASRRRIGLDCCRGYNSETHFNSIPVV